jgi:hypothetical protein
MDSVVGNIMLSAKANFPRSLHKDAEPKIEISSSR